MNEEDFTQLRNKVSNEKLLPEQLFSVDTLILWAKEALPASNILPEDHDCNEHVDHRDCISRDELPEYVSEGYDPEDIFSDRQLSSWAEENGWKSKEETKDLIPPEEVIDYCRSYLTIDEIFSDGDIARYCRDYIDPWNVYSKEELTQQILAETSENAPEIAISGAPTSEGTPEQGGTS